MAAPTSTSGGLTNTQVTTILKYQKTAADNITNGPGFMRYAKRKNLIVIEDLNGQQEQVPIDRGTNTNYQWFDDADVWGDTPDTTLIDSYVGRYNLRYRFNISDTDKMENAGASKIFDLLALKMKIAERAMKITVSQASVGAQGSDPLRFPGISDLFGTSNPASSSTYQGLSSGTYTWWAPDVQVITTGIGANGTGLRKAAVHQFNNLKLALGTPKVGLCDQIYHEEWQNASSGATLTANYGASVVRTAAVDAPVGRMEGGDPVADIYWRGIEMIFDEYIAVPTSFTSGTDFHVRWLDPEMYYYKIDGRWNFRLYKPRERSGDDNQWVDRYAFAFRAAPYCLARRAHGITIFDM